MSRYQHAVSEQVAQVVGLHDVRWLRADELRGIVRSARVHASMRRTGMTPNAAQREVLDGLRTLAGALRNGRVRLTPKALTMVMDAYPECERAGVRVVDVLAREIRRAIGE